MWVTVSSEYETLLLLGPSGPLDLHAGSGKVPSSTSAEQPMRARGRSLSSDQSNTLSFLIWQQISMVTCAKLQQSCQSSLYRGSVSWSERKHSACPAPTKSLPHLRLFNIFHHFLSLFFSPVISLCTEEGSAGCDLCVLFFVFVFRCFRFFAGERGREFVFIFPDSEIFFGVSCALPWRCLTRRRRRRRRKKKKSEEEEDAIFFFLNPVGDFLQDLCWNLIVCAHQLFCAAAAAPTCSMIRW